MWGNPPFTIADNCAVDVRDLASAREWYSSKLGLKVIKTDREDDSGLPFLDLGFEKDGAILSLIQSSTSESPSGSRPILYAKNITKAHDWFTGRGVAVDPITSDSGGNQLFVFRDFDGNVIEVCELR